MHRCAHHRANNKSVGAIRVKNLGNDFPDDWQYFEKLKQPQASWQKRETLVYREFQSVLALHY
jgi:hypothetical protein